MRRRAARIALITASALLGCLITGVTEVASATSTLSFTVNTTADTHDATPGDGTCADSANLCSLRAAVEEANA